MYISYESSRIGRIFRDSDLHCVTVASAAHVETGILSLGTAPTGSQRTVVLSATRLTRQIGILVWLHSEQYERSHIRVMNGNGLK
jgi:hypothetical protein